VVTAADTRDGRREVELVLAEGEPRCWRSTSIVPWRTSRRAGDQMSKIRSAAKVDALPRRDQDEIDRLHKIAGDERRKDAQRILPSTWNSLRGARVKDNSAKLTELDRRNAEAMVAVVLNGRKASEVVCLQLAAESLSCAVMSAHRARANSSAIPKRLRRGSSAPTALLVSVTMDVAGELSRAITRPKS